MKSEKEIRAILSLVENRYGEFDNYNSIFLLGYKMALQDVLEIKRPKAMPAMIGQAI